MHILMHNYKYLKICVHNIFFIIYYVQYNLNLSVKNEMRRYLGFSLPMSSLANWRRCTSLCELIQPR